MRRRHAGATDGIALDLAKGALAGAVATWAMDRLTEWLYEHEPRGAQRRERGARRGMSVPAAAARGAARAAGHDLSRRQTDVAGRALHWAAGIGAAAVYAAVRDRYPAVSRAGGTAFGAGFFVLVDETLPPLLGLTAGPRHFPWQTHIRGLSGHMVFGAVTEGVLDVLDRFG